MRRRLEASWHLYPLGCKTAKPRDLTATVNNAVARWQIFAPAISSFPPSMAVTVNALIRGDLLIGRSVNNQ